MTPQQFAEWCAADRLGVFDGDAWNQAAIIASTIHNEFAVMASRFGSGKLDPKELHDIDLYLPPKMRTDKPESDSDGSIDRFVAAMEARAH